MYDISFYEFVSDFEKTKIPPNFEIRDGDFRFNPRHPQHHTHYLRRRKHSAVPVIVGLHFPDKENNPELWHYLFLVLFKPFFSLEEMKLNDGETYVEKFNSWDITLIGAQSSSNGLYNTMIDAYQKAIAKVKEEEKTGDFNGDIFNQSKVNKTTLNGLYRTAVKVHDHNLVSQDEF